MLSYFLNIEGVTVLNKKQQSKVSGGGEYCVIKTTTKGIYHEFPDSEITTSAGARKHCADMIVAGDTDRCGFDCSYDGIGN